MKDEEKILEIINKIGTDNGWDNPGCRLQFTGMDAAKEIAAIFKSELRSELIAYDHWMCKNWGENIMTAEESVTEYLKQKK
jgi:hypothetical protein